MEAQVAVLGAGPAGAAAAIALARAGADVVLVEPDDYAAPRVGETFPPVLTGLLAELGVLDALVPLRLASHAVRAAWGDPEPVDQNHIMGPHGAGWHVDRARFDAALAETAVAAGARRLHARFFEAAPATDGWRLALDNDRRLSARLVIDATGRRAAFARRQGARRTCADALSAAVFRLAAPPGQVHSYALIETAPDGWWYSAPVPGQAAVAVFFSEPATLRAADPAARLAQAPLTAVRLAGLAFGPAERCAAGASRLDIAAGPDWLAVGDAAMTFDPMSGDGVCRALRSGLDGAALALRMLAGQGDPAAWTAAVADRFAAYAGHRAGFYALERRWPDRRFWRWAAGLAGSPKTLQDTGVMV
ncbi:MAG: FAD-binding monooxygenase [Caulobacter sp.]|jgi:flavin-dependent dehydrogenase|nr:FAD-binding monooxygenase [Caulobacter sp.]